MKQSLRFICMCSLLIYFCNTYGIRIKNKNIIPYLKEIKAEPFETDTILYPGVVYMFARNVNDSILIHFEVTQCVFWEDDLENSFYFADKLFVCSGDISLFNSIFKIRQKKHHVKNWIPCYYYSSIDHNETMDLFVTEKEIKKVSLSANTVELIVFGALPPPIPIDNSNSTP